MKHSTILVAVKCSERLPSISGWFSTSDGRRYFANHIPEWRSHECGIELDSPTIWYEEQKDKIVLSEDELAELVEYAVQQYDGLPIDEHVEKIIKEKL